VKAAPAAQAPNGWRSWGLPLATFLLPYLVALGMLIAEVRATRQSIEKLAADIKELTKEHDRLDREAIRRDGEIRRLREKHGEAPP
jgi:hypothetical protein